MMHAPCNGLRYCICIIVVIIQVHSLYVINIRTNSFFPAKASAWS